MGARRKKIAYAILTHVSAHGFARLHSATVYSIAVAIWLRQGNSVSKGLVQEGVHLEASFHDRCSGLTGNESRVPGDQNSTQTAR